MGPRKAGVVAPAEGVEFTTSGTGTSRAVVTDADGERPVVDFEVSYSPAENGPGGVCAS